MGHYVCKKCQAVHADDCHCDSGVTFNPTLKTGDVVVRKEDYRTPAWEDFCRQNSVPEGASFTVESINPAMGNVLFKDVVNRALQWDPALFIKIGAKIAVPTLGTASNSPAETDSVGTTKPTYTGGSSDYYKVTVSRTTTPYALSYTAECNDIIEALGMNFAEGNAFKALWRRAAQRTLGLRKAGAKDDGLYDAEKVEFFGKRLVEQSKAFKDGTS